MRFINAIKNDIKFQIKYGFYILYIIISIIYIGILYLVPISIKNVVAAIIIFSDPVALGLFFMGAIILFEKSEFVLNSLFITPLKINEYIFAKVISLAIISTLSSLVIAIFGLRSKINLFILIIGLILGSILASLIGIIVASRINSINQFIAKIIPLGTFVSVPPFLIFFGIDNYFSNILPGNIVFKLLLKGVGKGNISIFSIVILFLWIILFWVWSKANVSKMILRLGGQKNEI